MSQTPFDDFAAAYDETLPAHVIEHYLEKRARFVLSASPLPGNGRSAQSDSNSGESRARGLLKQHCVCSWRTSFPTVRAVGPRTGSEGAARQ